MALGGGGGWIAVPVAPAVLPCGGVEGVRGGIVEVEETSVC